MAFLFPLFLAGGLAIAVPIVLHLLRRRTQTVVSFPAVRLLHQAPIEHRRRRRLRELILLALRVAALLLLAAAFARPYLTGRDAGLSAPVTVVALDTSLSLSAPGQFERAREAARQAVAQAPAGDQVALVTFADRASLTVPPTADRGGVAAAIDAVSPGAGGTRYRAALARAAEAIGARPGRVVVITDLQEVGWEAGDHGGVPESIAVEVVPVPPPAGNLAVTEVHRDGGALRAAVQNYGATAVTATVSARLDGQDAVLASEPVEVPGQAAAEVRLAADLPARGGVAVSVDDPVGYAGDNVRYLVLDPPPATSIAVVTGEPANRRAGLYVERAIEVAGGGAAFAARVADGRAFSGWPAEMVADQAAIVVLGTATLDRAGREAIRAYLDGGGQVLVTLGPAVDVATLQEVVGVPMRVDPDPVEAGADTTVLAADARHPIFRPFSAPSGALGDVLVTRYRRLITEGDETAAAVLARFTGGAPALVERQAGAGRLLVFASDLDNEWNRFPLHPAFVPFIVETMRYLADGRSAEQAWTVAEVPAGVDPAPGIRLVGDGEGDADRRVAVNPGLPESNPVATSPERFVEAIDRLSPVQAPDVPVADQEREERQRLWQLALLAVFVALAAEGLIGRKAA
ncbi:MAG: BatA and WFA domain-containing protein [Vicinamibacterales bacterium]